MAAYEKKSSFEILAEITLSCPICFENYETDEASRMPMINTACGHSICFECTNKIKTCSLCNQRTPYGGRYIKNFAVLDQIGLMKSHFRDGIKTAAVVATAEEVATVETKKDESCSFEVLIYMPKTETRIPFGNFYFCKPRKQLPLNSFVGAARNALYSVYQKKIEEIRIYFQNENGTYGELDLTDSTKRIGIPLPNHSKIILEKATYQTKYQYICSFAEKVIQKQYMV
jgi:hypothetical protein